MRDSRNAFRVLSFVAVAVAACTFRVVAQAPAPSTDTPNRYPAPLPARKGPAPPPLAFRLDTRIPLPGPLPGSGPALDEAGKIRIPVAGGIARVAPGTGAEAEISPMPAEQDPPAVNDPNAEWVLSPEGKQRFRTLREGRVLAEKKGFFFRKKWHSDWKLKTPSATPGPPLVTGKRVFFASLDDQVYSVLRGNGHRAWAVDVEDRVSRPLALWRGAVPGPAPQDGTEVKAGNLEMILVVPDSGTLLIALDSYDGTRLASYDVPPDHGRIVGPALALADGRVAIACQGYVPQGASLVLLKPERVVGGTKKRK